MQCPARVGDMHIHHEPNMHATRAHPCPMPASPLPCSLLAGVRAASPGAQYILCLDDDVLLHRGLLAALVRDMEADPSLFMATGVGHGGLSVVWHGSSPSCIRMRLDGMAWHGMAERGLFIPWLGLGTSKPARLGIACRGLAPAGKTWHGMAWHWHGMPVH